MPVDNGSPDKASASRTKRISVSVGNLHKAKCTDHLDSPKSKSTSNLTSSSSKNTPYELRKSKSNKILLKLQEEHNRELIDSICQKNEDPHPSLTDGQVHTLFSMLRDVQSSRSDLNSLITELQKNYDDLIVKHARAENTIDKLKFRRYICDDCNQPPRKSENVCESSNSSENCSNFIEYSISQDAAEIQNESMLPKHSEFRPPLSSNYVFQNPMSSSNEENVNEVHFSETPSPDVVSAPMSAKLENDSDPFNFTPFTSGCSFLENVESVNSDQDFFKIPLHDFKMDSGFHGSEVSDRSSKNLRKSVANINISGNVYPIPNVDASSSNSSLTDTTRLNPNFSSINMPNKSNAQQSSHRSSDKVKVPNVKNTFTMTTPYKEERRKLGNYKSDPGVVLGNSLQSADLPSESDRFGFRNVSGKILKTSTPRKHSRHRTVEPTAANSRDKNETVIHVHCYPHETPSGSHRLKKNRSHSRSRTSQLSHNEMKDINKVLDGLSYKAEKLKKRSLTVLHKIQSEIDENL